MFNLEEAILNWRLHLAGEGLPDPEILEELESHLRDEIASRKNSGSDDEHAFKSALEAMGEAAALRGEFVKVCRSGDRSRKFLRVSCGIAALFVYLINSWTLVVQHELSPLEQWFGVTGITLIALYVAFMPYGLEWLPASCFARLAKINKAAATFVGAWPCLVLLQLAGVVRLEWGILTPMFIWCLYAAVVLTVVACALTRSRGLNHPGQPPPPFGAMRPSLPPKPPGPADLHQLLRSKSIDPVLEHCLEAARGEASRLGHGFIGTEHLLLGLLKSAHGSFANVLPKLNLDGEAVRMEIERMVPPMPVSGCMPMIPLTPRAQKAIRLAGREVQVLNQPTMGPEHLLAGLFREGGGVAARALKNLGFRLENLRAQAAVG